MRDVAAAAGVSKALVSIVFRRAEGASEATRARVLRIADEIGYRANRTASLLASVVQVNDGAATGVMADFHRALRRTRSFPDALLAARQRTGDDPVAVATALSFVALGA